MSTDYLDGPPMTLVIVRRRRNAPDNGERIIGVPEYLLAQAARAIEPYVPRQVTDPAQYAALAAAILRLQGHYTLGTVTDNVQLTWTASA